MSITTASIADGQRKIVVAVDFGTTYSGLAWTQTENPKTTFIVESWPDRSLTDEKVPTTIAYDASDSSKYRWGCQIRDDEPKHEWFKLALDPTTEGGNSALARKYPSLLPAPPGHVPPMKLVTDYLTALRKHMDSVLEVKLGRAIANRIPREYVLTVPAVWSPKARDATATCASQAGMGSKYSIHMITEPEAAALYELNERSHLGLQVGDTFVVCDAGGGTVDLISYTIESLNPTRLREAARGSGQACGSIFLNRIFAKYLKDRFELDPSWSDDILVDANERFEYDVKRKFEGSRPGPFYVPVPGLSNSPSERISRGKLNLPRHDIKAIFRPVIAEIIKLVKGQIMEVNKPVKAVLLVGGFGRNAYLHEQLQRELGEDVIVQQSLNPWTAVMRGALIKGVIEIAPTPATVRPVDARKAVRHVGTNAFGRYQEGVHEPWRRESDGFGGGYRVKVMNWFIKKDEYVKESKPIRIAFYYERKVTEGSQTFITMPIYECLEDTAPLYMTDSVKHVTEVKANLSTIPQTELDIEEGKDGELYYTIHFDIEMTCLSAKTQYALVFKGKRYDSVTADYV